MSEDLTPRTNLSTTKARAQLAVTHRTGEPDPELKRLRKADLVGSVLDAKIREEFRDAELDPVHVGHLVGPLTVPRASPALHQHLDPRASPANLTKMHDILHFMKVPAPVLLPLMRSRLQGDVLAWIFLHPERAYSVADIARNVGASEVSVLREVNRLAEADLITEERQRRSRMIRPNPDNPATRPLTDLLAVTFGPVPILRVAFADIPGVDLAFIYGSWAERHSGIPGPSPGDIDVLVVGTTDEDLLNRIGNEAAEKLGRDVNVQRIRPTRWHEDASNGFLATVRSRPIVTIVAEEPN